jgi:hypothetical protein
LLERFVPREVDSPPARQAFAKGDRNLVVDAALHEYDAIRSEIDHSLSNQVSILSFGAATTGLLVAAAATLWKDEALLAVLLLLFVVPAACFLVLAVHAGELVRMMRAGLFLFGLEVWINGVLLGPGDFGRIVTWEHWAEIRKGRADVDAHNRRAVTLVFALLGLGFTFAGFWRIHNPPPDRVIHEGWAIALLVCSLFFCAAASLWVDALRQFAYAHRKAYWQVGRALDALARPQEMSRPVGKDRLLDLPLFGNVVRGVRRRLRR